MLVSLVHTFETNTEGKYTGWSFFNLAEYVAVMERFFTQVPVGEHKISVYLDGYLAASGTLPREGSPPLIITGVADQGNGTCLLTWEDNGCGPYTVNNVERWSDDIEGDKDDARTSAYWLEAENLTATSEMLEYLVPGREYWIVVTDSMGTQTSTICKMPAVQDAGLNMSIEVFQRMEKDEAYTDLPKFSAAALNQDYIESYGLYIDLDYENIPANCEKQSMWVITLPEGVRFCEYSYSLNLFANGSTY